MTTGPRYWDANCFLAILKEEPGRVDTCRSVIQRAANGEVLIVTSALTLAEVLHVKGEAPLPAAVRQQVLDFFKNDYIHVRNLTRRTAESARDIAWDHGVRPADAIHCATALDARLPLVNTYDGGLLSKDGVIGDPALSIVEPEPPAQGDLQV